MSSSPVRAGWAQNQTTEEARAEVQQVIAMSSAFMWSSMNVDAALTVTWHFIDGNTSLNSIPGMATFPQAHTAENLVCVKTFLVQEWGMASNGTRLVTEGALGMTARGRELELRHATSSSHTAFNCEEGSWFVPTTVLELCSRYCYQLLHRQQNWQS